MGKRIEREMNAAFCERAKKPLRRKKELILLMLETLKLFYIEEISCEVQGKVIITIEKMRRINYFMKDKFFSFYFPFSAEVTEEGIRIYDPVSDIEIDNRMLSAMILILGRYDERTGNIETMYDNYCEDVCEEGMEDIAEKAWETVLRIIAAEPGYIRYDYDEEHADKRIHPLHHLDVNYSSECTYKIGLPGEVQREEFLDLLDIRKPCRYLA